jgi:pilus assembly protein CpaC
MVVRVSLSQSHLETRVARARAGVAAGMKVALVGLMSVALVTPIDARPRVSQEVGVKTGAKRISMGVGKSTIIELPQDAAEIFVGNPAVANAIVRTARKIYVIGSAAGQTSLFALDKDGHEIESFEINVGRDVGELSQILQISLPTAQIQVRTINDTIILTGIVDSAEDAERAADLARGFAKQAAATVGATGDSSGGLVVNSLTIRGRDQVMLKVTVSEMRRDIAKQLGITSSTWGPLQQYNPFGINGNISSNSTGGAFANSGVGTPLTTALNINSGAGLLATLQAFERYGVTRTLAEPTVTAVSGESAKFTVGGEFPYSTGLICGGSGTSSSGAGGSGSSASSSTCTAGAGFKPYGITLNFEPIVLSEGRILLHLATEISDLDFQHAVVIGGAPTPGLLTRKNETTIELPSGGSIASAGLIQQKSQQVINGMPGLLNIPILGTLFRSRDYQRNETELIIIVTPIIVKPVSATALAKPDDGFTDATDPQAWLLGRMNRLTAMPSNPEAARNYRGHVGFIQD